MCHPVALTATASCRHSPHNRSHSTLDSSVTPSLPRYSLGGGKSASYCHRPRHSRPSSLCVSFSPHPSSAEGYLHNSSPQLFGTPRAILPPLPLFELLLLITSTTSVPPLPCVTAELRRRRPIQLLTPSVRVNRGLFSLSGLVAHLRTLLPNDFSQLERPLGNVSVAICLIDCVRVLLFFSLLMPAHSATAAGRRSQLSPPISPPYLFVYPFLFPLHLTPSQSLCLSPYQLWAYSRRRQACSVLCPMVTCRQQWRHRAPSPTSSSLSKVHPSEHE